MLALSLTGVMTSVSRINNYVQIKNNYNNIIIVQPLGSRGTKTIFITPNNIRYYVKYLDSSVTVDDRVIRVTSGTSYESLITVPLADADELDTEVIIRVTVGLDPDLVTTMTCASVYLMVPITINFTFLIQQQIMCAIQFQVATKATQLQRVGAIIQVR